ERKILSWTELGNPNDADPDALAVSLLATATLIKDQIYYREAAKRTFNGLATLARYREYIQKVERADRRLLGYDNETIVAEALLAFLATEKLTDETKIAKEQVENRLKAIGNEKAGEAYMAVPAVKKQKNDITSSRDSVTWSSSKADRELIVKSDFF